jgi:hypothetical protein
MAIPFGDDCRIERDKALMRVPGKFENRGAWQEGQDLSFLVDGEMKILVRRSEHWESSGGLRGRQGESAGWGKEILDVGGWWASNGMAWSRK